MRRVRTNSSKTAQPAVTRLINLRGTNGSGKTYLVRRWMQEVGALPYPRRKNLFGTDTLCGPIQYYKLSDGGIVIGSYENNCGGCDTLGSFAEVENALWERLKERPPYILFEGVIVSHIYGYWLEFSKKAGGMTWEFLDTPVDECLRRIYVRNRNKPINEGYVHEKHKAIHTVSVKARRDGETVVVLPWQTAYEAFVKLMEKRK